MSDSRAFSFVSKICGFGAILLISSLSAHGETECAENLRLDEPGGSMYRIPIQDQGDFDNCYAKAAAEALDAYQNSFEAKPLKLISPLSLGLSTADDFEGGGTIQKIMSALKRQPDVCTEAQVKKILGNRDEVSFLKQLRNYLSTYNDTMKLKKSLVAPYGSEFISKMNPNFKSAILNEYGNDPFSNAKVSRQISCAMTSAQSDTRNTLLPFAEASLKSSELAMNEQLQLLSDMLKKTCSKGLIHVQANRLGRMWADYQSPLNTRSARFGPPIHDLLSEPHAQPVIMTYCVDLLGYDPRFPGYIEKVPCINHTSVIIGERTQHGRCEYLVRNSWGKNWCPKKEVAEVLGSDCEGSQVWVDREKFAPQIKMIYSLSPTQRDLPLETEKIAP